MAAVCALPRVRNAVVAWRRGSCVWQELNFRGMPFSEAGVDLLEKSIGSLPATEAGGGICLRFRVVSIGAVAMSDRRRLSVSCACLSASKCGTTTFLLFSSRHSCGLWGSVVQCSRVQECYQPVVQLVPVFYLLPPIKVCAVSKRPRRFCVALAGSVGPTRRPLRERQGVFRMIVWLKSDQDARSSGRPYVHPSAMSLCQCLPRCLLFSG